MLLTPVAPGVAPLLDCQQGGSAANVAYVYAADVMTVPASLAGLPAICLPFGMDAATGMPLSVQLVARRGREELLLRVAALLEQRIR